MNTHSAAIREATKMLPKTDKGYIALIILGRSLGRLRINTDEDGVSDDYPATVRWHLDGALAQAEGCIRTNRMGIAGFPGTATVLAERPR